MTLKYKYALLKTEFYCLTFISYSNFNISSILFPHYAVWPWTDLREKTSNDVFSISAFKGSFIKIHIRENMLGCLSSDVTVIYCYKLSLYALHGLFGSLL